MRSVDYTCLWRRNEQGEIEYRYVEWAGWRNFARDLRISKG